MDEKETQQYQAPFDSLIFLTTNTRLDIAFTVVMQSARCMSKTVPAHMIAAKHILRYLCGLPDRKITYRRGGNKEILGFSDSSHATGDLERSQSTTI